MRPRVLRRARIPGRGPGRGAAPGSRPRSGRSPSWSRRSTGRASRCGATPDVVWPYPEWIPYDRVEALTRPAYKGFAHAEHLTADALLAIARRVVPADLATVTQAGLGYIEFTAPGVDKGSGLARVAAELGVDPADALVFGDMPNDVPMFRWAGWRRVAVANAHPEVLGRRRRGHRRATTTTAWPPGWRPVSPSAHHPTTRSLPPRHDRGRTVRGTGRCGRIRRVRRRAGPTARRRRASACPG